jgi:Prolyl oligopeptidase family
METMKGETWLRSITAENLHFDTAIEAISTKEQREQVTANFHKAAVLLDAVYQSGDVKITPIGLYSLKWGWNNSAVNYDAITTHEAAAVQSIGDFVWAVEADEGGREIYTLSCYSKKGLVWRNKSSIGPYLCVKDNRCYVVEATAELRYGQCVSLDAETGKGRRLLFTEESLENNLSLLPGENGCIFLESDNSGTKKLYVVEGHTVNRVGEECVSFVPVGYSSLESNEVCFFGRVRSFASPWTAFGDALRHVIPDAMRQHGIDLFHLKHGILVTSAGGVRQVYRCSPNSKPKRIDKIVGMIGYDTYGVWEGRDIVKLVYTIPGETPSLYYIDNYVEPVMSGSVYAKHSVQKATSKDGTEVPYVLVQKGRAVRGIMAIVYGAYGIPTGLGTSRWKPYLDAGWAIVFGLIRGGGDFGDAWADAARTYKKWKSIEDTIAVIQAAQKRTGIDWKRTCIYGRSAGGYTLGAIVAHHGSGGLVGAAYAEVPFVDVLRTTSTPSLPLTVLEYNEFGNPAENPRDLKTIRELSPVDALPAEGAPGVFVVARTSLNDREVLPYETVKWIQRLRGSPGDEKYLSLTGGHGHFVGGATGYIQKAGDFLLLNGWLDAYKKSPV